MQNIEVKRNLRKIQNDDSLFAIFNERYNEMMKSSENNMMTQLFNTYQVVCGMMNDGLVG